MDPSVKALDQILKPSFGTRIWRALGYRLAPLHRIEPDDRVLGVVTTCTGINLSFHDRFRLLIPGSKLEVRTLTRLPELVQPIDSFASWGVVPPGVE